MNLTTSFTSRDFDVPISTGLFTEPQSLAWSAFGGPHQAILKLRGPLPNRLKALSMLRCPVMISDPQGSPVWWGYVSDIDLEFNHARFKVSIGDVYNRVQVCYSYLSPDNIPTEQLTTAAADHSLSELEYGIRQITLHQSGIDENSANQLRDTFLASHCWPKTVLSNLADSKRDEVTLNCRGWFSTLSWQGYESANGFYANHGPGPGSFNFGHSTAALYPSQSFLTAGASNLRYVYFMLRKFGNPTQNISVVLFVDGGGTIGAALANSNPSPAASLSSDSFQWVRFDFSTPYPLTAGTKYWLTIDQNGVSAANYFSIRLDENMGYSANQGLYFNGSAWVSFPTVTNPSGIPDTYFRAVCVQDTGTQLQEIASSGNQFFRRIESIQTGVASSPYRANGKTCLVEIEELMRMGTTNNRQVLAKVSPNRILQFYEQPDPDNPTVLMDQNGSFFTSKGKKLSAYSPPVGEWAGFAGTDWVLSPWDKHRLPACFIESVKLDCLTGSVTINEV